MINDQAFHILTWYTTIEDHTPYPSQQQVLGSSVDQVLTTTRISNRRVSESMSVCCLALFTPVMKLPRHDRKSSTNSKRQKHGEKKNRHGPTPFTNIPPTQITIAPHRWCNASVLVSIAVDRGFELRTDQTKDYKLGMCCFFERHTALKRNSKVWLARNKNSVYEWGDMSIRGLLFQ
jgi:hypothetical protein